MRRKFPVSGEFPWLERAFGFTLDESDDGRWITSLQFNGCLLGPHGTGGWLIFSEDLRPTPDLESMQRESPWTGYAFLLREDATTGDDCWTVLPGGPMSSTGVAFETKEAALARYRQIVERGQASE